MEEHKVDFDFKKVKKSVWLQDKQFVGDYWDDDFDFRGGLPEGRFNKKYPGMGATFCEFHAKRASIIVFPFRKLAIEKDQNYRKQGCNTFFVGTDLNNRSTSKAQIKDWYSRNKGKNPKFSVVADSIKKLVKSLQEIDCDPYSEFFLVLDEVEMLQLQSGFRKSLPLCFDYFKKFEKKCLVSATLLDFADEKLKEIPTFDLEVYTNKSDEYGVPEIRSKEKLEIRTFGKNPHWGIANQLVKYLKEKGADCKDKFFVGLNSIEGLKEMVEIFKKAGFNEDLISVHTSTDSKENFLKKYNKKEIKDGKLPTTINLTTCINWSGIDLTEEVYSIAISLKSKSHHAFSFENMVQFFGRSRYRGEKSPHVFAFTKKGSLSFTKPKIPFARRREQLEKLINFIETEIEEPSDKKDLKKAISNTDSALIYLNPDDNPKVNWLLEDLENYEILKVEDYKKKGERLLAKLNERYEVNHYSFESILIPITPSFKNEEEKEGQTLDSFLDNLDADYPSEKLVERFLDEKSTQSKKVAAYWYLFGRVFSLTEEESNELATKFSKLYNPYQISSLVVAGLRFYVRHRNSYSDLIDLIYKKRNNQKNITPSKILSCISEIEGYSEHFDIIDSGLTDQVSKTKASIIAQYFFGVQKFGNNIPKFKIEDNSLDLPDLVKKYPAIKSSLDKVSSVPTGSGLQIGSIFSISMRDLIDTKF